MWRIDVKVGYKARSLHILWVCEFEFTKNSHAPKFEKEKLWLTDWKLQKCPHFLRIDYTLKIDFTKVFQESIFLFFTLCGYTCMHKFTPTLNLRKKQASNSHIRTLTKVITYFYNTYKSYYHFTSLSFWYHEFRI